VRIVPSAEIFFACVIIVLSPGGFGFQIAMCRITDSSHTTRLDQSLYPDLINQSAWLWLGCALV
jgi:hypothetical protein